MTKKLTGDRRSFLKAAGAAAAGAWLLPRWTAAAGPLRIGLVSGTLIGPEDVAPPTANSITGKLTGSSRTLAGDLLPLLADKTGSEGVIIHGGGLLDAKGQGADFALDLLRSLPTPVRLTLGPGDEKRREEIMERFRDFGFFDGRGWYAYDHGGYRFVHLETAESAAGRARLRERDDQLGWLEQEFTANLSPDRERLLVLVVGASVLESEQGAVLERADRDRIARLGRRHGQMALVLCGGAADLRADWFMDTGGLALTAPPLIAYPCGGRTVEVGVAGPALAVSKFVQTRRLDLVEASYQEAPRLCSRVGSRQDRYVEAVVGDRLEAMDLPWTLPLAPRGGGEDEVTLALVSDTHLCLERFMPPKRMDEYGLIGHFKEKGSLAIYRDLLDQISTGRHRIEFYDEFFAKDPDNPEHYLERPVDHLLIDGDLTDRGREEEGEIVRRELLALPAPLRDRVMLAMGNHDVYFGGFVNKDTKDPERPLADFFDGLGPSRGRANYAVELADWLTLVVLDTTIPNQAGLGYDQELIDRLDDFMAANRDRVMMVANHQPIFPISIVPPLMNAYLRASSHFTPKHAAAQDQLQALARKHPHLKLLISGHYHGVCCDQFKKQEPAGGRPDDRYITHLQVPCTVEYPCAYRLLTVRRDGDQVTMDYTTCYTRLHELRDESRRAPIFKYLGTNPRVPHGYEGTMAELAGEENIWGDLLKLDPYDLMDMNVRGFKDGTAREGKGNTGKPNITGRIEVTK